MAIKLVVSNKVSFTVRGTTNNEDGKQVPFEFSLTTTRLNQEEIDRTQAELLNAVGKLGNHNQITDLLCGGPDNDADSALVKNWSSVRDESNAQIPFSPPMLRSLIQANPGLHTLIWRTYGDEVGVKAPIQKN